MKPADIAVALDDEARGPVVLADNRDFYGQCERFVLAVLGQYDKLRTFVEARHQHAAVVTHGADDERRLHVMLVEALHDESPRTAPCLRSCAFLPSSDERPAVG